MAITTSVTAEVETLSFTLTDGRKVTVRDDGDVTVRRGYDEYSFDIPTVEDVISGCDKTDDNEIPFRVRHRH